VPGEEIPGGDLEDGAFFESRHGACQFVPGSGGDGIV
jgi:hypothetical protein